MKVNSRTVPCNPIWQYTESRWDDIHFWYYYEKSTQTKICKKYIKKQHKHINNTVVPTCPDRDIHVTSIHKLTLTRKMNHIIVPSHSKHVSVKKQHIITSKRSDTATIYWVKSTYKWSVYVLTQSQNKKRQIQYKKVQKYNY